MKSFNRKINKKDTKMHSQHSVVIHYYTNSVKGTEKQSHLFLP